MSLPALSISRRNTPKSYCLALLCAAVLLVDCTLLVGCSVNATSQLPEKIRAEVSKMTPPLQGYELDVTAHARGEIELLGYVSSIEDKARVMDAVGKVPGVVAVADKLSVKAGIAQSASASQYQDAVISRLENELIGSQYLLTIQDAPGGVVVRGQVDSELTKSRVLELASREVPSTVRVIDEIVLIAAPSDEWIFKQVSSEVARRFPEWREKIMVTKVDRGVVSLSGALKDHWEIDSVLATVVMVPGVKDIASAITINGQPYHSEGQPAGKES